MRYSLLTGAALAALSGTDHAAAQTEVDAAQSTSDRSDAATVADIIVTGSRIRRTDYTATSPIVTVGAEALGRSGQTTVEAALNQLPQFQGSVSSASTFPGNGAQANINLRGLGTNRALILLDGRRLQPSNGDGTIDVNTVPDSLIESVEVVTGGASTAYGSDAIAGVVNFRLKHNFEGITLDAQSGITSQNDASTQKISMTIGQSFGDGRGEVKRRFDVAKRVARLDQGEGADVWQVAVFHQLVATELEQRCDVGIGRTFQPVGQFRPSA